MLTSGEAFYQLSSVGVQARQQHKESVMEEFWSFLEQDFQTRSRGAADLAGAARRNIAVLRARKAHCAELTLLSVRGLKEGWLQEVALRRSALLRRLLVAQQQSDTFFMQVVLAYHRILTQEVDAARRRASDERQGRTVRVLQAEGERRIRTFAVHLRSESRGRVNLTHISDRSPQLERCERAVLDNADPTCRHLLQHVSVLNVFKLQNSLLAELVSPPAPAPTSSSRPPVALTQAGKTKGLFCCLSPQRFYSFAVFGLHCQRAVLPPSRPGRGQVAADWESAGGAGEDQRKRALRERFFPAAWHSSTQNAPRGAEDAAGSVAATLACSQALACPALRFSRWSCSQPSTLRRSLAASASPQSAECFLALCRVRIVHQKTVAGPITEEDITAACELNFDAVFSSDTQEYVLLQPRFVLPEFFMQVHFSAEYLGCDSGEPASSRIYRPLPGPLRWAEEHAGAVDAAGGALWRALLRHPQEIEIRGQGDASPLRSPGGAAAGEEPSPEGADKLSHRRAQRQKQRLVLAVQEEVNRFRERLRAEVLRQSALPVSPAPVPFLGQESGGEG